MKYFNVFLFTLFSITCFSQQSINYDLFWNNYSVQNPAATGLIYKHFASVNARTQWIGLNGSPKCLSAVYDYRSEKLHGGIGLNYEVEKFGFFTTQKMNLNYAYQFPLTIHGNLSFGASIGLYNLQSDPFWIAPQNSSDPLLIGKSSGSTFNVNAGIMYKSQKLILGFSCYQLNQSRFKIDQYYYQNPLHLFANAAYIFKIGENFEVKPQLYIRTDLIKTNIDINCLVAYKKKIWAGATYRTNNMYAFMAGVQLKEKFRISYSFSITPDFMLSNLGISHEVGLAFMLK